MANKKKEQGNADFKAGENTKASLAYKEGADLLKDMSDATEEQQQESQQLHAALLSNLAAAYLKIKENAKAAEACKTVRGFHHSFKTIFSWVIHYLTA